MSKLSHVNSTNHTIIRSSTEPCCFCKQQVKKVAEHHVDWGRPARAPQASRLGADFDLDTGRLTSS